MAKKATAKKRVASKKAATHAPTTSRRVVSTRRVTSRKSDAGGNYFGAPKLNLKFIDTGCTMLNLALGGGWCLGRVANIIGDKATGKTLLAIEACANFNRQWPKAKMYYLESEAAFDKGYAGALGMPIDAIDFGEKGDAMVTVEDFFERLEAIVKASDGKQPTLVVLDSMDALSDREELLREIGEGTYGTAKAKLMSQLFRRLVGEMEEKDVTLIIVSQVRDKIGVTYGRKWTRSGGRALDFYASQVVVLANVGKLYQTVRGQKITVGIEVKAALDKNKVGLPYRECQFDIRFGYGTDEPQCLVDYLKSTKTLKEADILEKEVPGYLNYMLAEMNREEMRDELARLRAIAVRTWYEIQQATLPTRSKYGD